PSQDVRNGRFQQCAAPRRPGANLGEVKLCLALEQRENKAGAGGCTSVMVPRSDLLDAASARRRPGALVGSEEAAQVVTPVDVARLERGQVLSRDAKVADEDPFEKRNARAESAGCFKALVCTQSHQEGREKRHGKRSAGKDGVDPLPGQLGKDLVLPAVQARGGEIMSERRAVFGSPLQLDLFQELLVVGDHLPKIPLRPEARPKARSVRCKAQQMEAHAP